eukprot:TRINITY_DN12223_c0_g1_i2.p1 TRINITY_DN12223_c0_g1~~TRINITY_DN12223_c0_g1_i2.p1  ORF type:complete len:693 (+),score=173.18 TRINITY_DN12223_c0_g1_i2:160-2238(+)
MALAPYDGGAGSAALPPSHPGYPAPQGGASPGPVAATFRIVKRNPTDGIGWSVHNDDLRILKVEPGLPAAAAGIQQGMRVADINGQPVRTVEEMRAALADGTVFNVTVEMGPAQPLQVPAVGTQVTITGLAQPPEAVRLNGRQGTVVGRRGALALVEIAGHGTLPFPVSHLSYESDAQGEEWREVSNPEVGRVYYWNTITGETTWEHPLAERLPPGLEEVQLAKGAGEPLGLKLEDMLVTGVLDDSPADRCNAQQFLGWRLTHIDGERVGSTEEIAALSRGQETLRLRFEVEELAVRKEPEQHLGCELRNMILAGVVPGSPLDRALDGDHTIVGQRLTHVNGVRVHSAQHVSARAIGCDVVRLRFELEEILVEKAANERLGLLLEGMRLQACERGSASKQAGVGRFVGRLLTHVNGVKVNTVGDVAALAGAAPQPGSHGVLLRFETAAEEDMREEALAVGAAAAAGGVGSPPPATPPALVAPHPLALSPADYYPKRVPYLPQPVPPPGDDPRLAQLEQRVADLELSRAGAGLPNLSTPQWSPAARVLVGPPPWEGGTPPPGGELVPIPSPAGHVAVRGDSAVARRFAPPRPAAARPAPAYLPQGDRCAMCGGPPEIDCFDCGLPFCRPCCLLSHREHHRHGAHGNMEVRRPAAAAPGGLAERGAGINIRRDHPPPLPYGGARPGVLSQYEVC